MCLQTHRLHFGVMTLQQIQPRDSVSTLFHQRGICRVGTFTARRLSDSRVGDGLRFDIGTVRAWFLGQYLSNGRLTVLLQGAF